MWGSDGPVDADRVKVVAQRDREIERLVVVQAAHRFGQAFLARAAVAEVAERQHPHDAALVEVEREDRRRLAQKMRKVLTRGEDLMTLDLAGQPVARGGVARTGL